MALDPELMKQLIGTFKSELQEQSLIITNGLLQLEAVTDETSRDAIVTAIFRAAHNIKGAARSLGINHVGEIAHHIESIFSAIKNNELNATSSLVDTSLNAVDKMQEAMQAFTKNENPGFDLAELSKKLDDVLHNKSAPASAPVVKNEAQNNSAVTEEANYETIRVGIDHVERISSLIEEMTVNKIAIEEHHHVLHEMNKSLRRFGALLNNDKTSINCQDAYADILKSSEALNTHMRNSTNEFSILSNSLQDEVKMLRLVPVSNLVNHMPRYVRDLSHELKKDVSLTIKGGDVKVDKMILDLLNNPIIHILRNCIDHGIEDAATRQKQGKSEVGNILINIKEESGRICISITDDGGGINNDNIMTAAKNKNLFTQEQLELMSKEDIQNIIFMPGFSTSAIVSDVSGRGVGLDVVKTNLAEINGSIDIQSILGKGTTINLYVPLTLASERGLLVKNAEECYFIPTTTIERVLIAKVTDVIDVEGCQAILVDHHTVTLNSLTDFLHLEQGAPLIQENLPIIVLNKNNYRIAILVDEIIGEKEIVIKPLSPPLSKISCVAGGTLSTNNQPMIVLSADDLIHSMMRMTNNSRIILKDNLETQTEATPHILVVDDSITTRTLEKNILENKNYQVTVAVNGKEAWDLLQKNTYSLLITDVNMPIMDGFVLTENVKKSSELKNLPVIIVTSLGSNEEKMKGINAGADAYIVKNDFESGELLKIVEQLV